MLTNRIAAVAALVAVAAVGGAHTARASALSFCDQLSGDWDGQYCHTSVVSERNAVRDIKVAIPDDLVENSVAGPPLREYLSSLVNNWKTANTHMAQDSFGEENYQVFQHGSALSAVFHETYHGDGPKPNNAYRTFTFDMASGRRLQLSDLVKPGVDPLAAIPPLGEPFIQNALDQAAPPHDAGTYPFTVDRWAPARVYSGAYRAWAITPAELILYLPDYPVGHDEPINYTPGIMQWSMDGGTVEVHIPLTALGSILRKEFGGT